MKIAIRGVDGTGKDALAAGLARALGKRGCDKLCITLSPPFDSFDTDLTLLCGTDWADNDGSESRCSDTQRESEDNLLRHALIASRTPFQVVYGSADVRVTNALKAIDAASWNVSIAPPEIAHVNGNASAGQKWRWECDKCSDSSCERRLFSELLR